MDEPSTAEELRGALEGDRCQILECLATHDELSSSEIRDLAEIPDSSTYYQFSLLESWGLIKPVGTRYVGEYETGIPATIYTLTRRARQSLLNAKVEITQDILRVSLCLDASRGP